MAYSDKYNRSISPIAQALIEYALGIGAIQLIPGGRELRSGRRSPYFFNAGEFHSGNAIADLGNCYSMAIQKNDLHPHIIFGPAYKGIPIAVATAAALGKNVSYAFNRKEAKGHGERGEIVGATIEGKKVIIVDDVITTGGSAKEAFEFVLRHGGIPVGCVIAFDRQERTEDSSHSAVQEFQRECRIPVYAIATVSDLISYLKYNTLGPFCGGIRREVYLEEIESYLEKYRSI